MAPFYLMRSLIILFAIVSCGPFEDTDDYKPYRGGPGSQSVDPEMQEYYNRFEVKIGVNANHIPSTFSYIKEHENAVGLCWDYGYHDHEIEIDIDYWNRVSDLGREQLIFHELGHCALGLGHNEETFNVKGYGSIPESIMFPTVFGEHKYYEVFRNYYHRELKP